MCASVEIPLHPSGVLLVDADDAPLVSRFRWRLGGYEARYPSTLLPGHRRRGVTIYLPALLLGGDPERVVIYKNGDRLDNRRANLVRVPPSLAWQRGAPSPRNRSGYRGVSWRADKRRWVALAYYQGKKRHLGYFRDPIEAARAYDRAVRELYGPLALTNEDRGAYPWQQAPPR